MRTLARFILAAVLISLLMHPAGSLFASEGGREEQTILIEARITGLPGDTGAEIYSIWIQGEKLRLENPLREFVAIVRLDRDEIWLVNGPASSWRKISIKELAAYRSTSGVSEPLNAQVLSENESALIAGYPSKRTIFKEFGRTVLELWTTDRFKLPEKTYYFLADFGIFDNATSANLLRIENFPVKAILSIPSEKLIINIEYEVLTARFAEPSHDCFEVPAGFTEQKTAEPPASVACPACGKSVDMEAAKKDNRVLKYGTYSYFVCSGNCAADWSERLNKHGAGPAEDRTLQMIISTAIFGLIYILILTELVDRMLLAAFGAMLVIATGLIPKMEAWHAISLDVVFLLAGMMMLAYIAMQTGLFEWIAVMVAKLSKGYPYRTILMVSLATGFVSAFLDNVTTVVLICPIVLLICGMLKIEPLIFFLMVVMYSNIGGTATLIGDPPNIVIGSAAGYSFNTFAVHLTPVILVLALILAFYYWLMYRKSFNVPEELRMQVVKMDASSVIKDKKLMVKTSIILILVLCAFVLHSALGVAPAVISLLGAMTLSIWSRLKPHDIIKAVDWHTLFFFIGLFILVGAMEYNGFMEVAAKAVIDLSGGSLLIACIAIIWGTGLMSGVVDNIPMAIAAIPLIQNMIGPMAAKMGAPPEAVAYALWWSLALGVCLGGNLTPIGASANVVTIGFAERNQHPIQFKKFLIIGIPTVMISLAVSSVYVWLRYIMPLTK